MVGVVGVTAVAGGVTTLVVGVVGEGVPDDAPGEALGALVVAPFEMPEIFSEDEPLEPAVEPAEDPEEDRGAVVADGEAPAGVDAPGAASVDPWSAASTAAVVAARGALGTASWPTLAAVN